MNIQYKLLLASVLISTIFFITGYYFIAHAATRHVSFASTSKADVLHLNKQRAQEYKTVNPSYYEHTGILGVSAGMLVLLLLGWVYFQNYLYHKKLREEEMKRLSPELHF